MKNRKLYLIFPFFRIGGIESHIIYAAKDLIKSGIELKIVTLYIDKNIDSEIKEIKENFHKPNKFIENAMKIRILRYLFGIPIFFILLIYIIPKNQKILAFSFVSTYILCFISYFKKMEIYYFEPDIKLPNKEKFKYKDLFQRMVQRFLIIFQDTLDFILLKRVKGLITISQKESKNAKLQYSGIIKNIEVINPPLTKFETNINQSKISKKIKNLFEKDFKYLSVVGALDSKKNPIEALKLLEFLMKNNLYNYKLIYIGAGDLLNNLQNLTDEMNLKENVVFLNNVNYDERNYVYQNIYCNLFFAKNQSWGITPLEALYFGKPSIVSNEAGCSEFFIKHNLKHVHNLNENFECCLKFLENDCKNFKFNKEIIKELYVENHTKKLLSVIF